MMEELVSVALQPQFKCCLGRPSGMGEMIEPVSVPLQHGLNAAWAEQAGGGWR